MAYGNVQTAYKLTTNIPGIEGDQLLGEVTAFTPPIVAERTADFTNGMGIVEEVDLGLQKLESTFTLQSYRPEIFSAIAARKQGEIPTTLTFYSSLAQGDGSAEVPQVQIMRGHVSGIPAESVSPDGVSTYDVRFVPRYYKRTIGETDVIEVDLDNLIFITGGVDRWEQKRTNLRLT